jgi:Xaa-Pro aminopeptidase
LTRYERLREGLAERGCSCAVLVGPGHAVHLAGYDRYLSSATAVVVADDGTRTLVVPRYELEAARGHADAVVAYGDEGFLDFDWLPKLVAACRELCRGRIGVAGIGPFEGAVAIDDLVAQVRRVKDDDELHTVARSVALSLGAQRQVAELAGEGMSEIELFTSALAWAQNEAGEPIEFVGSVFCGPRTAAVASPVEVPGARRPARGDPVLADLALRTRGYSGDTTRTTIVGDNPEVAAVVQGIASILAESGGGLLPGMRACDVFERTRRAIGEQFPEGVFAHHAGHGIGIEVGEDPQLIPSEPMVLEAGMVFAVEPAVYFPGRFGVRVEDVYAVTPEGGVRLGA